MPEQVLYYIMLAVVPVMAVFLLLKRDFGQENRSGELSRGQLIGLALGIGLMIGGYDGFFGPGAGTFLMLAFTGLCRFDLLTASGNTKVANSASNLAALATFALAGQVLWAVGGSPSADPASFTDVEPGIWYYPAVCWCQQEGLIAGYADGILDGVISRSEERQYLAIISDESRRLARLVRRMLDVSQLQSMDLIMQKTPFDLSESMRRVLVSMEKKITSRGLDVDVEIPEDPVIVLGDNDLLTQVVYNLLENAAKFASPNSTLYLGLARRGEKAVVTVRNRGETIAAEELPRLFERFHKSDKSRSADKDGVGLGLYIVRTILEQHRETITAASEDGVTTFTFTVQLAEEVRKNTHKEA